MSRIKQGDRVYIQNMPVMSLEVIDVSDPAYVVLQAPNGMKQKAGRGTVISAKERGDG
jgi:hypothetical protein